MSAVEEYRKLRLEHPSPSGALARADLYLADAALAELTEALLRVVGERDTLEKMLRLAYFEPPKVKFNVATWLADLRRRVEGGE